MQVLTIHRSKGLEFPVVFIVAVEDGVLPHERVGRALDDLDVPRETPAALVLLQLKTEAMRVAAAEHAKDVRVHVQLVWRHATEPSDQATGEPPVAFRMSELTGGSPGRPQTTAKSSASSRRSSISASSRMENATYAIRGCPAREPVAIPAPSSA